MLSVLDFKGSNVFINVNVTYSFTTESTGKANMLNDRDYGTNNY